MRDLGMELGNHTINHPNLTGLGSGRPRGGDLGCRYQRLTKPQRRNGHVKSAQSGPAWIDHLMHDIHGATVDAAPAIIRGLRERGSVLVTMSELVGTAQPGRVYLSR